MIDEKRSERIENKLDLVAADLGAVEVHISEIKADLKYHIKRTDILEKKVDPVWLAYRFGLALLGLATVLAAIAEIVGFYRNSK